MISHTRSANYMPTNFCGTFRSALPLQVRYLAGAEGNHLEEGPLAFWSPVWDPKNDLKKEPSLAGPLGPLGGHLGPKGLPKGCQKETQRGVQNGAKSRSPKKVGKSEFDTLFTMF